MISFGFYFKIQNGAGWIVIIEWLLLHGFEPNLIAHLFIFRDDLFVKPNTHTTQSTKGQL
jgi:hypothetical protein